MHCRVALLVALTVSPLICRAQMSPQQMVQKAVDTEIAANRADHTPWMYLQVYRSPGNRLKQWVVETHQGDIKRVLEKNGAKLSEDEQRQEIEKFVADEQGRSKQRKDNSHDDEQTEKMLRMLPTAFIWTQTARTGEATTLHFVPDPKYVAPTYEARVFAGMEGDITVDNEQFRIVALKGHLVHDVTFGFGLFGRLKQGGSFEMVRREFAPGKWQITETHVHVQGHALLFKTISEDEDDVRSDFRMQPENITLQQAENEVMQRPEMVARR